MLNRWCTAYVRLKADGAWSAMGLHIRVATPELASRFVHF